MVCLLAESTRYLTNCCLDIFIHGIHWVSKKKTKLTRNLPVKPTIPSILPFNPNLHQLLKPLQCQPRLSGRQHLRHLSDFNRFKFQRCENSPSGFTAGGGNEVQHSKNWSNGHLQTQKICHDRLEDPISFHLFCPKRYQKIVIFPFWKGGKKTGQNSPPLRHLDSYQQSVWHLQVETPVWHLQVETPGVGQTPVAEPWWNTSLHLKSPIRQHLSLPIRNHLAATFF